MNRRMARKSAVQECAEITQGITKTKNLGFGQDFLAILRPVGYLKQRSKKSDLSQPRQAMACVLLVGGTFFRRSRSGKASMAWFISRCERRRSRNRGRAFLRSHRNRIQTVS